LRHVMGLPQAAQGLLGSACLLPEWHVEPVAVFGRRIVWRCSERGLQRQSGNHAGRDQGMTNTASGTGIVSECRGAISRQAADV
jgi:hypothetical protein